MAGNNSDNVGVGKPLSGGAVWYANYDAGTELPTNATSDIPAGFTCVGYISEDGMTEATSTDSETITAWGGDTVLTTQTSFEKTYEMALLETSTDSLKLVWGDDNVSTDDNGFPIVDHTTKPRSAISLIIEMNLTNGTIRRTVVPKAQVGEVGDITYQDGEAVAYDVTLTALPVDDAVAHDYYAEASTEETQEP